MYVRVLLNETNEMTESKTRKNNMWPSNFWSVNFTFIQYGTARMTVKGRCIALLFDNKK